MSKHSVTESKLRSARARCRLTQLELAAAAGCCITSVSIAERGGPLTEATAAKLAAVLGVDPAELRQ
jgi:transcriptional regulator with XRE-family HTH domain